MLHCKFNLSLHDLDPNLHRIWSRKAKHMYLQKYSQWPLVSVRECSLRVRNAHVSVCCRNLYSYSGKKTTLLPLCACTVLSPERPWSIIWILRNYCHAADYWDNHANSSWELFRSNSMPAALCCCWRGSCSGRGGSFWCWHPAACCKTVLSSGE